ARRLGTVRGDVGLPDGDGLVAAESQLRADRRGPDPFQLVPAKAQHLILSDPDDPPAVGRREHRAEPSAEPADLRTERDDVLERELDRVALRKRESGARHGLDTPRSADGRG